VRKSEVNMSYQLKYSSRQCPKNYDRKLLKYVNAIIEDVYF